MSEMSTQEEREQALVEALKTVQMFSEDCGCELYEHCDYCERKREVVEILSECSILPRADYDAMLAERAKLRRALWRTMRVYGYPKFSGTQQSDLRAGIAGACQEAEMLRNDGVWTPAAHELAKEMEGER